MSAVGGSGGSRWPGLPIGGGGKNPPKKAKETADKTNKAASGAIGGDQTDGWFDPNNPPQHDCKKLGCTPASESRYHAPNKNSKWDEIMEELRIRVPTKY